MKKFKLFDKDGKEIYEHDNYLMVKRKYDKVGGHMYEEL